MYVTAAILPIAYIIGLIFTLKTHSHLYKKLKTEKGEVDMDSEHSSSIAQWGKLKCVIILIIATCMFLTQVQTLTIA